MLDRHPMRVLTHLGFGNISFRGTGFVRVRLDTPFLGQREQRLNLREIFDFTPWAVLRVISMRELRNISNLQFQPTWHSCLRLLRYNTPPDETKFAINFETGDIRVSQPLGLLAERYVVAKPYLDRWSREGPAHKVEMYEHRDVAITKFEKHQKQLAGTSGGIFCPLLMSTHDWKVLRFYIAIAPPQGVIYKEKFDLTP